MRQPINGRGSTGIQNARFAPYGVARYFNISFTSVCLLNCGFSLGLNSSVKLSMLQAFPATVSFFDGGVLKFWDIRVCALSGVTLQGGQPLPIQQNH